jgi:hypothetical protein
MAAAMTPSTPTGTLMKKMNRQSVYSTSRPPSDGPIAGATMTPSP